MAFQKKTWTDRMVEYAGRRKLTNINTKQAVVYDVERAEGAVSKEGDAFSSQNMNDLEQRVADGFSAVEQTTTKLNQDLGCLHYGTASDSMATILNAVLTYETIPQSETRHFSIQCQEGYFICRATAWDNNWIGGIASPGTDDTKNTYSFIRFASRGADTVLKKLGSATVFPKILLQPNAGQGTTDTYTLDVTEKSTLSIESMQSWYDNASVSIVADGTVLYTKSHQTGGSNRTDTSAIGTFDVSGNSTIAITFSATATNAGARGWAALNNISVS